MNVISLKVTRRSLEEPPVSAFIVGDVRLHLVVLPLVGDQHAFDSCYLMSRNPRYISVIFTIFTLCTSFQVSQQRANPAVVWLTVVAGAAKQNCSLQ